LSLYFLTDHFSVDERPWTLLGCPQVALTRLLPEFERVSGVARWPSSARVGGRRCRADELGQPIRGSVGDVQSFRVPTRGRCRFVPGSRDSAGRIDGPVEGKWERGIPCSQPGEAPGPGDFPNSKECRPSFKAPNCDNTNDVVFLITDWSRIFSAPKVWVVVRLLRVIDRRFPAWSLTRPTPRT
jgi:hypothetical protein